MRLLSNTVLVCLCAGLAMHAAAERILPAACGDDNIKFKVNVEKAQLDLPPLDPAKARLVFIETLDKHGIIGSAATARFAVDGAWVGANKGDSFFFVDVDPGQHQLCANWQAVDAKGKNVGLVAVKAVAGHVYYFEAAILQLAQDVGPPGAPGRIRTDVAFHFVQLNDGIGKNRLAVSAQSTFTSK